MGKHKIRTTINPGTVLTVDDAEFLDLTRQGLIKSEEKGKPTEGASVENQEG